MPQRDPSIVSSLPSFHQCVDHTAGLPRGLTSVIASIYCIDTCIHVEVGGHGNAHPEMG